MDNEPPAGFPPPKRPWGFWRWPMLLTPSVVVIVIPLITGRFHAGDLFESVASGILPLIGALLCIVLGTDLASHLGTKNYFGWLFCCLGVTAVNFAIFFAACTTSFR